MSSSLSPAFCSWPVTIALLRHEARSLWQNRTACVVLALVLLTAVFLRVDGHRRPQLPEEVCYVLYWEADALVRHLAAEAAVAREQSELRIEVAPADRFADKDGIIRYPPGAHSIQLRSREGTSGGPRDRVIQYWYSGADPAAIWP